MVNWKNILNFAAANANIAAANADCGLFRLPKGNVSVRRNTRRAAPRQDKVQLIN